MIALLIYTGLGLLIIVVVALLVRQAQARERVEPEAEHEGVENLLDEPFLNLAERIFDPADSVWLRDELGFPHLANALVRSRQQMALRWLKALKRSCEGLVRVPDAGGANAASSARSPNWRLLWLTLRLQLLLGYAMLVVRFFGPYHRLVPSLGRLPSLRAGKANYRTAGTGDVG